MARGGPLRPRPGPPPRRHRSRGGPQIAPSRDVAVGEIHPVDLRTAWKPRPGPAVAGDLRRRVDLGSAKDGKTPRPDGAGKSTAWKGAMGALARMIDGNTGSFLFASWKDRLGSRGVRWPGLWGRGGCTACTGAFTRSGIRSLSPTGECLAAVLGVGPGACSATTPRVGSGESGRGLRRRSRSPRMCHATNFLRRGSCGIGRATWSIRTGRWSTGSR